MSGAPRGGGDEREDEAGGIVPVYLVPEDDAADATAEPPEIGRVAILGDFTLEVSEAAPAHEAQLREALSRVNAKAEIVLRSAAPVAGEDSVGAFAVTRGAPGFEAAARAFLERYYALRLG